MDCDSLTWTAERFDAWFGRADGWIVQLRELRARVPADHPLRLIRAIVDEALDVLSPEFDRVYARIGRPGIAPEKQPRVRALMTDEHFSVDGTLIQAWASHKSFQLKPGIDDGDGPPPPADAPNDPPGRNAEQSWRGQKRSNETHGSTTDPDAWLARKSDGQAGILTHATGTAERDAALVLVDRQAGRRSGDVIGPAILPESRL